MAHNIDEKERTGDVKLTRGTEIQFSGLLLSPPVLKGLTAAGFITPSPIQLDAIPIGRCGFDLIVQAKSGTGKTCVFAVIALDSIKADINFPQVLVLAPTREIVVQIADVVTTISSAMPKVKCQSFIGGMPIAKDKLNVKKCHIAIGTPGRIKQLIQEKFLKTDSIRLFVLDEADKLLEGNFQEDINWIYHSLPGTKQMLALSATYPEELAQLLTKYMLSPTFVRLNVNSPALLGIKQFFKLTAFHALQQKTFENKVPDVLNILSSIPFGQCLIFSNYQMRAQSLCDRLNSQGWPATYISGKQSQEMRLEAINKLRQFKCRILISTDLISRGIDVENVNLVVNLDVPWDVETYLHRIGRAGRFGTYGIAITLASRGAEEDLLQKIFVDGSLNVQELPDKFDRDTLKTNLGTKLNQKCEENETAILEQSAVIPKGTLKSSQINGLKNYTDKEAAKNCNVKVIEERRTGKKRLSSNTRPQPPHEEDGNKIGAVFIESLRQEANLQLEQVGVLRKAQKSNESAARREPESAPGVTNGIRETNTSVSLCSAKRLAGLDTLDGSLDLSCERYPNAEQESSMTQVVDSDSTDLPIGAEYMNNFSSYEEMLADLDSFVDQHAQDFSCDCLACAHKLQNSEILPIKERVEKASTKKACNEVTQQLRSLLEGFEMSCQRHVKPVDDNVCEQLVALFRKLLDPERTLETVAAVPEQQVPDEKASMLASKIENLPNGASSQAVSQEEVLGSSKSLLETGRAKDCIARSKVQRKNWLNAKNIHNKSFGSMERTMDANRQVQSNGSPITTNLLSQLMQPIENGEMEERSTKKHFDAKWDQQFGTRSAAKLEDLSRDSGASLESSMSYSQEWREVKTDHEKNEYSPFPSSMDENSLTNYDDSDTNSEHEHDQHSFRLYNGGCENGDSHLTEKSSSTDESSSTEEEDEDYQSDASREPEQGQHSFPLCNGGCQNTDSHLTEKSSSTGDSSWTSEEDEGDLDTSIEHEYGQHSFQLFNGGCQQPPLRDCPNGFEELRNTYFSHPWEHSHPNGHRNLPSQHNGQQNSNNQFYQIGTGSKDQQDTCEDSYQHQWNEWYRSILVQKCQIWHKEYTKLMLRYRFKKLK